MTILHFSKFEATGNDFIVVEDLEKRFPLQSALIASLCHRQKGIGADGLLLIQPSETVDLKMRIFNADGKEASMCGNGLRCVFSYGRSFLSLPSECYIESQAGTHFCKQLQDGIETCMGFPKIQKLHEVLTTSYRDYQVHIVDTGVPHGVVFVDDLSLVDFEDQARLLREHPEVMPNGMNVNFISLSADSSLSIRTFERGVEKETLSCGTGCAAAAYVSHVLHEIPSPITLILKSEERLICRIEKEGDEVKSLYLKGPCHHVFDGKVDLSTL